MLKSAMLHFVGLQTALRSYVLLTIVLSVLTTFSTLAVAQPGTGDEVKVSATAERTTVAPGGQLAIAVMLDHAPHFHTWPSLAQDVLPPEIAEFAIRTEIAVTAPDGIDIGRIQWPTPTLNPVPDLSGKAATVDVYSYADKAVAYVPVRIGTDLPSGQQSLKFVVSYQACDESTCLPPMDVRLEVELTIDAEAGSVTEVPALFNGFDATVFADPTAWEALPVAAAATSTRTFFGIPVPTGAIGLALLGALGGLILNLTPCVLPVIPLKVLAISKHAGSPGRTLYLGAWMAAGVVGFWLALGVLAASVTAFVDPSRLFGIWWITVGIGLIIAIMGVGIMGAFEITLPQKVYALNPKADSPHGSFLFGIMTAVLGLPCFGFVAGALLAGAAALPKTTILAIFAGIGFGMASPYLVLSLKPSLLKSLPKAGPASDLVKQVMGLLLLAAAAYFLGAGVLALIGGNLAWSTSLPWWSKVIHWWVVAGFALAAGGWLAVRTIKISKQAVPRVVFAALGLVLAAGGGLAAYTQTDRAAHDFWIPFTPVAYDEAIARGDVVVLDFTAEWCLNCKALEAAVLSPDPVGAILRGGNGVVPFKADLTSTQAVGWDKLRDLGQTGIPLLVISGPGLDQPWLSNAYTTDQVISALEQARAKSVAAR